jgi:uncharacterized protein (TIGR03083 family)
VSLGWGTLLGVAHAERQRFGRTIQYAHPETWEKPSACDGWWNRDVVAHLAAHDTAAAQLMKGDPAVELEEHRASLGEAEFTVDGFNAITVDRRSATPLRELFTTWGNAAEAFLAYAALLSQEDRQQKRFPWLAGDIAARYLIQSRLVEWWIHGEDARATNGLGPQWEHWPIHLTIDLGVRMLPWSLGRAGFDFSGRSVSVQVGGAGEGSWHWGLGTGEVPPEHRKPDATIRGRAPQLGLVTGQRLSPDDVLGSGLVVLGGDESLAEIVLRTIRAYP